MPSAQKYPRLLLFGGLLLALLFGGNHLLSGSSRGARGAGETSGGQGKRGIASADGNYGVAPRPSDSGSRAFNGGWYLEDGQRYAHLAADSTDITELLRKHEGDESYVDMERWTLGELDEQALAQTYQCDKLHLDGFSRTCDFRLRFVVRRTGDREGKAVFVQPTSQRTRDDYCQAYSDCVAHSVYLGTTVPIPSGQEEAVAFAQDYRMIPFKGSKSELQALFRSEYEQVRATYEQARLDGNLDPRTMERLELSLKFLELRKDDAS